MVKPTKTAAEAKTASAPKTASKRTPKLVKTAALTVAEPAEVVASASPATSPETQAPQLKAKEFVDRVCTRSGAKRKDAKTVIETTLAVLGDALAKGEAINLPGLGKAWVSRQKDTAGGEMLIVKIKRNGDKSAKKADKEALAEAED